MIHNTQTMEATQVSTDRWMNKEDVEHLYDWILLSHKKERNPDTSNNMDVPRGYNAKWNKLKKDKYHMISLICGI